MKSLIFVSDMNRKILFRSLYAVEGTITSHGCGMKRVLLSNEESESDLTQIAFTTLKKGEFVETHVHATMEECFLIRSGRIKLVVGSDIIICFPGDFIRIPREKSHSLEALEESAFLTIGCAVE